MAILYEWRLAEWINGEALDIQAGDRLGDLEISVSDMPMSGKVLCLCKVTGDGVEIRSQDKTYAVRSNGRLVLPLAFPTGHRVPHRFHAELNRWQG